VKFDVEAGLELKAHVKELTRLYHVEVSTAPLVEGVEQQVLDAVLRADVTCGTESHGLPVPFLIGLCQVTRQDVMKVVLLLTYASAHLAASAGLGLAGEHLRNRPYLFLRVLREFLPLVALTARAHAR
jgi:hypothetical protein